MIVFLGLHLLFTELLSVTHAQTCTHYYAIFERKTEFIGHIALEEITPKNPSLLYTLPEYKWFSNTEESRIMQDNLGCVLKLNCDDYRSESKCPPKREAVLFNSTHEFSPSGTIRKFEPRTVTTTERASTTTQLVQIPTTEPTTISTTEQIKKPTTEVTTISTTELTKIPITELTTIPTTEVTKLEPKVILFTTIPNTTEVTTLTFTSTSEQSNKLDTTTETSATKTNTTTTETNATTTETNATTEPTGITTFNESTTKATTETNATTEPTGITTLNEPTTKATTMTDLSKATELVDSTISPINTTFTTTTKLTTNKSDTIEATTVEPAATEATTVEPGTTEIAATNSTAEIFFDRVRAAYLDNEETIKQHAGIAIIATGGIIAASLIIFLIRKVWEAQKYRSYRIPDPVEETTV